MRPKNKNNHSEVELKECSVILDRLSIEVPADEAEEPTATHSKEIVQCDNELNMNFEFCGPLDGFQDPLKLESTQGADDGAHGDHLLDATLNENQSATNGEAIVGSSGPSAGPSSAKKRQKKTANGDRTGTKGEAIAGTFGPSSSKKRQQKTVSARVKRFRWKFPKFVGSSNAMLFHKQAYHDRGVEKTFECHFCKKIFARHSLLSSHFRSAHKGQRFECTFPMCLKSFGTQHNLKNHINVVHRKANEYNCTKCSRKFHLKGNLNRHYKICCSDCYVCQEEFPTMDARDQHLHTVHNVVRIMCTFPTCTKTFANEKTMLDHQKKCRYMPEDAPITGYETMLITGDDTMLITGDETLQRTETELNFVEF